MEKNFASSGIFFNVKLDFNERVENRYYYDYSHFWSKIGGYYAIFNMGWGYLLPVFLLYFLLKLSNIIKRQRK